MELKYEITQEDNNKTINEILINKLHISTRLLNKLIKLKKITSNQVIVDTRSTVNTYDIITINLDYEEDSLNIVPTKKKLDIIYEDEWLIVVNKSAGMPIHPSRLHYKDSLSNAIKFYFDSIGLNKKIRPVNRLDIHTSGLVIFAKCEYIQECFIQQMLNKTFKKEYLCLVEGLFEKKSGTIKLPIARKKGSIIERCIDEKQGKTCITHYKVEQEFCNYSFVRCQLETGRTHQIRIHMSEIGHPILGDTLYGKSSPLIDRQALHSFRIKCIHPITKETLLLESALPYDMKKLKNAIEQSPQ